MNHDGKVSDGGYEYKSSVSDYPSVLVFGLGYVGLPLAVEFSREGFETRGYDIDREKIRQLRRGDDPTGEIGDGVIRECGVSYTNTVSDVSTSDYILVAVPTPVTETNQPDTSYIRAAGKAIGEQLSEGTTVVLESTVYPGATRNVLIPALEATSKLTAGRDFLVGYSPERIVPGGTGPGLRNAIKIVSGQNGRARDEIAALYEHIVDAGLHLAPSIETAEAAKCLENAQRDLNIAFVNEFALGCHQTSIEIDAQEVLEAARTKWNFHDYSPGLVGGHCIPVDPYYLIHAFEEDGFSPTLMKTAREVNNSISACIAMITADALRQQNQSLVNPVGSVVEKSSHPGGSNARSRVLLLGLTYKPNTTDVRSPVFHRLIEDLRASDFDVTGFDPHADQKVTGATFDMPIQRELSVSGFNALIVTTPHDVFQDLDLASIREEMAENPVIVDVMGAFEPEEASKLGFVYERL